MPKTPGDMLKTVAGNLKARTGRSLDDWQGFLAGRGPADAKARAAWIRAEYGLGPLQAQIVADPVILASYEKPAEEMIAAQYAGDKAGLRPICDRLLVLARDLGPDVRIHPLQTYVTLSRARKFAIIRPATRTRVDLGLVLDGLEVPYPPAPRRDASDRITHLAPLSSPAAIDAELQRWLKIAYDRNG